MMTKRERISLVLVLSMLAGCMIGSTASAVSKGRRKALVQPLGPGHACSASANNTTISYDPSYDQQYASDGTLTYQGLFDCGSGTTVKCTGALVAELYKQDPITLHWNLIIDRCKDLTVYCSDSSIIYAYEFNVNNYLSGQYYWSVVVYGGSCAIHGAALDSAELYFSVQ